MVTILEYTVLIIKPCHSILFECVTAISFSGSENDISAWNMFIRVISYVILVSIAI